MLAFKKTDFLRRLTICRACIQIRQPLGVVARQAHVSQFPLFQAGERSAVLEVIRYLEHL